MSQESPRIDAHCHLFNIFYLTSEIAEILWDTLWGHYPHKKEARQARRGASLKDIRSWFDSLKGQIAEVSYASFHSYEENFLLLTRAYQQSFETDEKLIVYPLMMDIHYMIAEPCSMPSGPLPPDREGPFVDDPRRVFDDLFHELKNTVIQRRNETLPEQMDAANRFSIRFPDVEVEKELNDIHEEIVSPPDQGLKAEITDGVELSRGFEKQVWGLMELRAAHPDSVFPFFAVDPRRIGIMDVIKKGQHFAPEKPPLVGKEGPFFGLKLYPRLGYKPMDLETYCKGLYEWCQTNYVPITCHCNIKGFPEVPGWKYNDFGNPDHWKDVLGTYPALRIDFAHFGKGGDKWADTIVGLMKTNGNNVFTDLACYTDRDSLSKVRTMLANNQTLKNRLMFGTDFDVMLATDFIDLKTYFEQFKGAFSRDEMDAMSRNVPRSFLNRG